MFCRSQCPLRLRGALPTAQRAMLKRYRWPLQVEVPQVAVPKMEAPQVEPDRTAGLPVPPVTPPSAESKSAAEVYLEHKGSASSGLARRSPEDPESTETTSGQAWPPQCQQRRLHKACCS